MKVIVANVTFDVDAKRERGRKYLIKMKWPRDGRAEGDANQYDRETDGRRPSLALSLTPSTLRMERGRIGSSELVSILNAVCLKSSLV